MDPVGVAKQKQEEIDEMTKRTGEMRSSEALRWQRVRAHLEGEGIDPADAVLASIATEGTGLESGVILSSDGRLFVFDLDFLRDESGREISYEDARVTDWRELDAKGRADHYWEIEVGRGVFGA